MSISLIQISWISRWAFLSGIPDGVRHLTARRPWPSGTVAVPAFTTAWPTALDGEGPSMMRGTPMSTELDRFDAPQDPPSGRPHRPARGFPLGAGKGPPAHRPPAVRPPVPVGRAAGDGFPLLRALASTAPRHPPSPGRAPATWPTPTAPLPAPEPPHPPNAHPPASPATAPGPPPARDR